MLDLSIFHSFTLNLAMKIGPKDHFFIENKMLFMKIDPKDHFFNKSMKNENLFMKIDPKDHFFNPSKF